MRVSIEPTVHRENTFTKGEYPTNGVRGYKHVSIETFSDDETIEEVVTMFRNLLISWGFAEESVDEYIHLET